MKQRKGKAIIRGFTLIELLVVISIIAVLMSILMPSLSKARKQAGGVLCSTNLKQISLAYMLYRNDFNNMPEYSDSAYSSGNIHWAGALRGYYSDVEAIRLCPLAKKSNPAAAAISGTASKAGDTFFAWFFDTSSYIGFELGDGESSGLGSYGENSWIRKPGEMANNTTKEQWNRLAWRGTGGADIPLIFDSRWITLGVLDGDPIPQKSRTDSLNAYCVGANIYKVQSAGMRRHKSGINMFFLDFSGRYVELEELWDLKWNREYKSKGRQEMDWVKQ